jgi:hypothetical protein
VPVHIVIPYSVSNQKIYVIYCYELFQVHVLSFPFNILHFAQRCVTMYRNKKLIGNMDIIDSVLVLFMLHPIMQCSKQQYVMLQQGEQQPHFHNKVTTFLN